MADKSVNIIWRKNNSYDDINSLLSIVNYSGKINIYNFTDDELSDLVDENDRILKETKADNDEYVNNLIKNVLDETKNDSNNIFFIDSCILYDDIIDLNIDIKSSRQYVQINNKKNSLYLDLGYKTKDININNLEEIQFLEDEIDIIVNGTFDENYLDNYYDLNINSSRGVKLLLIEYMLGKYIVDINRHIPKNTLEIHYLGIIKYLKTSEIKYLTNCFKVNQITYEGLDYLLSIDSKEQKNGVIIKINEKIPKRSIFRIRNLDIFQIQNSIIETIIEKKGTRFKIGNIPNWVDKTKIKNLHKFYPSLINNIDKPYKDIKLCQDITYISKNKYRLTNKNIEIVENFIKIDDILIREKCYSFLYFNNKHILLLNSIEPLKLNIVKDQKLVNIFTYDKSIDSKYNFIGPILPFFNRFVSLISIGQKLYKIAVFEKQNLKLVGLSKIFRIDEGIPRSLLIKKDNLHILLEIDEKLNIGSVNHVKLFTEICNILDINDAFTLEIKDRNNIKLLLDNYDNIAETYENFVFNRQNEDILCTVKYDAKIRIFDIDKRQLYYKDFIYLPKNNSVPEKTSDLYFHSESNAEKLKKKCIELGLSISENFKNSKYYIIEHKYFEKLTSLELSSIIENNCLIISLIENSEINSPNFKKTYTSNQYITKLFLFNIAKNESYIQFIFDKIIHDNQYDARKQFMEIDKNKMFNETNIYKTILKLRDENKSNNIKLCEKGGEIWTNIKMSDLFKEHKYDKNLEYIVKYIIDSNFKLDIGYNCDNIDILEILEKINFLGDSCDISNNNENLGIYDIVISKDDSIFSKIDDFSSPAVIYILDNKSLITI